MADRTLDETPDADEPRGRSGAAEPTDVDDSRTEHRARILPFPIVRPRRDDTRESDGDGGDVRLRDVLGRVLRDERQDQDRTLADVADAAHVSLPYLSEVERGVKEVSSDLLDAICDALDVTLADVLERSARRLRAGSVGGSGARMLAA